MSTNGTVFARLRRSFVGTDDAVIGRLATEHLIEQGCTRIAYLRGPETATGAGRLKGFRDALAANGLSASESSIIDPVAAGALKAILEAGLRIPQDVAVIGAGNVHYSDLLRVSLTTIDQDSAGMAEHAAKLLLRHITSKAPAPPEAILLNPRILVRDSTIRRQT